MDGLFTDRHARGGYRRVVVTFIYGIGDDGRVPLDAETVVEEAGVSLTIPPGSRDAPYSVLLETDSEQLRRAPSTSMANPSPATR